MRKHPGLAARSSAEEMSEQAERQKISCDPVFIDRTVDGRRQFYY